MHANSKGLSVVEPIEDITCPRVDMNFIFGCSTRYRDIEISRYRVAHPKIKFTSTSGHVNMLHCLLCKHSNDDASDDFPKISDHFPKISEDFQKIVSKARRRFLNLFRRLPKIFEGKPMMFQSYSNTSEYFVRDYVAVGEDLAK